MPIKKTPILSEADKRVLRFLAESDDYPQLPLVQTYVLRPLLKRHDLDDEQVVSWIARNLKILAALEKRISHVSSQLFGTKNESILARLVLNDTRVRTLRRLLATGTPPRHTHVSETINAQRRLMGAILQQLPFPPSAKGHAKWLQEFERDWLSGLLLIPCQCSYPDTLSDRCKEEICASMRKPRAGGLIRTILADIHGLGGLDGKGVRKLFQSAHKNTSPLSL